MCISKWIKWILKKSHREKIIFCIFFQSSHQVDMKNVVESPRESFAYFNALETRGGTCLGHFWTVLDSSGQFSSEQSWTVVNSSGNFWTVLDFLDHFLTFLGNSGQF